MEHTRSPVNANENIRLYRQVLEELALEQHLAFGDVFAGAHEQPDSVRSTWTDDGIHLNAEGYRQTVSGFCSLFAGPKPVAQPTYKLAVQGVQLPAVFDLDSVQLARSTEGRVTIAGLLPGRYQLSLSEKLLAPIQQRLTTASDAEWVEGKTIRFDFEGGQLDLVRKAIVAKNMLYFNRYRPENETYLFGFRKHEQGQNASEVPEFDKLVAQAETEIARLRRPVQCNFVLIRFDR
jgi:hypothetical protein